MSNTTLVENLLNIDLLEPEKVSEICGIAAETIAAYSTSYAELEAERDALREKLIETAQELNDMIYDANSKLEQDICATDATPPDYFDAQTVHDAMVLANKLEGEG